ncbi:serine/threonine-protein phosphatase 2A regulatory subunit B'' subunit beta-like isoform X2 [Ochotona curzoniae]|uniref:serine/threonine-protein phosphatase 2A regulatory subunit B'' subunit beta-like isoform X2 n=1 Tax=Ochotona curzoniae TaxID=130825 RepID=UPI001B3532B1|nr:serine/threonine-protein phosphatase 2A regulatory subunit B'' subunit beta-like isoform X2 [Ochotona curzoniae]XP_040854730.1 serine/threonine-protein phosphatase 2A regulatory subunit B'' subunit beta-like isoform X2 [Ochotona curzoniae]
MPPGKQLRPVLKLKVDELFLRWLSEAATQRALRECLRQARTPAAVPRPGPCGGREDEGRPLPRPSPAACAPVGSCIPASQGERREHVQGPNPRRCPQSLRSLQGHRWGAEARLSPSLPPAHAIPAFHFPFGRPSGTTDLDAAVTRVKTAFSAFPRQRAFLADMSVVAKACSCPLYWKAALFYGAGGQRKGSVSVHSFVAMWRRLLQSCHDPAARFLRLLARPGADYLEPDDLLPFLQDVVDTHPGLAALREVPEHQSPYISTVVQRIFYSVNRSWSGRITCSELRRSDFLQHVSQLEVELGGCFSYKDFRVVHAKFQELDTDGDLRLRPQDLARHADHAISSRMIDRLFSGAVTRNTRTQLPQEAGERTMSYGDFVWFLLSEEDKTTPTSVEYWFRCLDVDGDGVLSCWELEFFYTEQCQRLLDLGVEPLPFPDCLCQMLDLVQPRHPGLVTLGDLKRCGSAPTFLDTFFNLDKYLEREQQEPAGPREGEDPVLTTWERYVAAEFALLEAEEEQLEEEEESEVELSPQTRPHFFPPPVALGLFEEEEDDVTY